MSGTNNAFEFDLSGIVDTDQPQTVQTDALDTLVEAHVVHVDRAIRGAIIAGYDGIDIHRDPLSTTIESIEPWCRPEPDAGNGCLTERYSWHWFSEDTLNRILQGDVSADELDIGVDIDSSIETDDEDREDGTT